MAADCLPGEALNPARTQGILSSISTSYDIFEAWRLLTPPPCHSTWAKQSLPAEDPTRKSSEEETRGWKEEEGIFAVAAVAVIIISLSDAQ